MDKKIDVFSMTAGIVMVVLGMALLAGSIFFSPLAIYGCVILIIGIVILATLKQQEYIEPIKETNKNKGFH